MKSKLLQISIVLLAAHIHFAWAGTGSHSHHSHSVQKSHVHGVSELQLSIDTHEIEIQFSSPASNIVGFEHHANTKQEKQRVKKAKAVLSQAKDIFKFHSADCTVIKSDIDVHDLLATGHAHSSKHKEVTAQYRFKCQSTKHLKRIDVTLFKAFSGITEIKSQWITATAQGMSVLTPHHPQLHMGK